MKIFLAFLYFFGSDAHYLWAAVAHDLGRACRICAGSEAHPIKTAGLTIPTDIPKPP